ncbi:antirepressor [Rodentibacter ratti]|uniref:Antirepressor n=1 Tax=Rodentibacter ratti TaxID=1906745 RepID=A0A1V3L2L3_9PAST|nr:P22AR C-terminal domain-containing protein [Rodentibacter ratti]OOF84169.1 antirepressor [Rodentibacter ratti]
MTTLTFQTTTLSVINQQNQTWLLASEIGKALGYPHPIKGIQKIYDRHQDEFTPNMTALIDMRTNGGVQKVRIFSLRGCHLIGMLSHTKVAKDFRKWVLDILDKETAQPKQLALPEPEKKYTFEFTEQELQLLPWIWFIALRGTETCRMIYPAMETIGSKFSGAIYGQAYEYKHTIREVHKLLKRLTADFQYDYESNWRVLKHLNNYNPKSNNYQVI